MPDPLALCLEDLQAPRARERFLRCVAVAGRLPGLALSEAGEVVWQRCGARACELWVSADERLMLLRPGEAAAVTVARAGRTLAVPSGKPVVLKDGDEISVGRRRYRVHVHGSAKAVAAPSLLPESALAGLAKVAAVLTLGASTAGCPKEDIEVRENPPVVAEPPPTAAADAAATASTATDGGAPDGAPRATASASPSAEAAKPAASGQPVESQTKQ